MADPATLRSLAQRAREATGPDRELDKAVSAAVLGPPKDIEEAVMRELDSNPPPYTDLDGLPAIIRDVLPAGCGWEVVGLSQWPAVAHVWPPRSSFAFGEAATPALALLSAALDARAAIAEAQP